MSTTKDAGAGRGGNRPSALEDFDSAVYVPCSLTASYLGISVDRCITSWPDRLTFLLGCPNLPDQLATGLENFVWEAGL
jgi:hypothetical protein